MTLLCSPIAKQSVSAIAVVDDIAILYVGGVIVTMSAAAYTAWAVSPEGTKAREEGARAFQDGVEITGKALANVAKTVVDGAQKALDWLGKAITGSTPANPDPKKHTNVKKISSNKEANKIAKEKGYDSAEK